MIKSFASKVTQRLANLEKVPELPSDIQRVALRKLRQLDAATRLEILRVPPGNRLEALEGDRAGQHSIRINGLPSGAAKRRPGGSVADLLRLARRTRS